MDTKKVYQFIDDAHSAIMYRKNAMDTDREAEFISDATIIMNRAEELVNFLKKELGIE